jgi:hypothetical protein
MLPLKLFEFCPSLSFPRVITYLCERTLVNAAKKGVILDPHETWARLVKARGLNPHFHVPPCGERKLVRGLMERLGMEVYHSPDHAKSSDSSS